MPLVKDAFAKLSAEFHVAGARRRDSVFGQQFLMRAAVQKSARVSSCRNGLGKLAVFLNVRGIEAQAFAGRGLQPLKQQHRKGVGLFAAGTTSVPNSNVAAPWDTRYNVYD